MTCAFAPWTPLQFRFNGCQARFPNWTITSLPKLRLMKMAQRDRQRVRHVGRFRRCGEGEVHLDGALHLLFGGPAVAGEVALDFWYVEGDGSVSGEDVLGVDDKDDQTACHCCVVD